LRLTRTRGARGAIAARFEAKRTRPGALAMFSSRREGPALIKGHRARVDRRDPISLCFTTLLRSAAVCRSLAGTQWRFLSVRSEPIFSIEVDPARVSGVKGSRVYGVHPTMKHGQASRTALSAAGHRAAHQAIEGGLLFADPLAIRILGRDAEEAIALSKARPERRALRFFVAMRSRFAEESARRAIEAGVRQILVLGAGLDTFAYRLEPREGLRVFELDHPATQRDKRARLAQADIAEPAHVAYVAHDFEHGDMTDALVAGGLDVARRTFVLWLGVAPYLTEDAVYATLVALARFPGGVEVVFDYANPPHAIEEARVRDFHRAMAARVAESGEPFRCFLETALLRERARSLGFVEIEDLDRAALVELYLPHIPVKPRPGPGGHVVRMATG